MRISRYLSVVLSVFALFIVSCGVGRPFADVVLPAPLFSDHMVLQRDSPVAIWGKASPNSRVKVLFRGKEKSVIAKADSSWIVHLDPSGAGGPFVLQMIGKDTLSIKDVLVGEVWICSGQSNMEMQVGHTGRVNNYKAEIAGANYPEIRYRNIPYRASLQPNDQLQDGEWQVCSPETVEFFSATAYFFARKLYRELQVPIGLVHASVGGTPVEAWTPASFISQVPGVKPMLPYEKRDRENINRVEALHQQATARWNDGFYSMLKRLEKHLPDYSAQDYDDSDWKAMMLPQAWEDAKDGPGYCDGVVWFRKSFVVDPEFLRGDSLDLDLGYIHDESLAYLNGNLIGKKKTLWGVDPTRYRISSKLLRPGMNVLSLRIINYHWIGGICRDETSLWMRNNKQQKLDLAGKWNYRMIFNFEDFPEPPVSPSDSHEPAVLYNGMIHSHTPMAIRGCIWYQGEENATRPLAYKQLFPLIIRSWREAWGLGDFPFYYVQLANYMSRDERPEKSHWAALREAQHAAFSMVNTGEAVTIDIGEADNIHPKNKQDVGLRLALLALNGSYGKEVLCSGPVCESMEYSGDTIRLSFIHTGSGLVLKGPRQDRSFALAGSDRVFKWASASAEGDQVLVWSPEVPHPVALRYAWANNPVSSLYNAEGLPASPFRTDDWDLELVPDFKNFPKVDAHIHLFTRDTSYLLLCKENNLHLLTLATNSPDLPPIREQVNNAAFLHERSPEAVSFATCFGMEHFGTPGWEREINAGLERDFNRGAVAVKVWKDIGMTHHNKDGSFVFMDDTRFDPLWEYIATKHKTLVNHVGEPKNCWLPLEEMTVINDRWYYADNPGFHMYLHPGFPSHEALMASRDHVLDKHPDLSYVGCHLGSLEYSLEAQAAFLEQYPRASLDISARIPHFRIKDREKVRAFILKYQDRLLYGTDIVFYDGEGTQTNYSLFREQLRQVYLRDWEYFTSSKVFTDTVTGLEYKGLDLPPDVLEKLYFRNAVRMYPGLKSSINAEWL